MIDWEALEALLELRDKANAATERANVRRPFQTNEDMNAVIDAEDLRRDFGYALQRAAADLVRCVPIALLAKAWCERLEDELVKDALFAAVKKETV